MNRFIIALVWVVFSSAGLRAASRSLSVSGRPASATAAAMAGVTFWAKAGAHKRVVVKRAAVMAKRMIFVPKRMWLEERLGHPDYKSTIANCPTDLHETEPV